MATVYDGRPVGQFVFDRVFDAFEQEVVEDVKIMEKRLNQRFNDFFDELRREIGGDTTGRVASRMGETWKPLSEDWIARKKKDESVQGQGYFVGLKGLLRKNIQDSDRLTPQKAYGKVKVEMRTEQKRLPYGPVPKEVSARLEFIAFPKVGRALGRLITPFSRRQQTILRYNEPFAQKGATHARPLLFPMYRYYMEQVLPDVFEESFN